MVVFSGLQFIFRFLPIFLIVYYLTPQKHRNAVLFLGSMVFYAVGEPQMVVLLLGLTVVNWLLGRGIVRRNRAAAVLLFFSILLNGGILVGYKMMAGISENDLMPLGLSFYIFRMLSYSADLYKGRIRNNPRFVDAAAYFTMFPQVTQGPIMRYSQGFADGAHCVVPGGHSIRPADVEDGLINFILGLSMKLLLADRFEILWNQLATIGYVSISTPLAWIGAYSYAFRLYFDFWGYSLMAAGLSMMLGFPFIRNFSHPYASRSVTVFYRDWHATLGSWFRDYLYFPLGGSRGGVFRTILNLFIVWLITGLWHGATLNYLIWGLVLFALIIWEKFVVKKLLKKIPLIGHLHVLVIIPVTWVIFAITDLTQLKEYFIRLFPFLTGAETAGMQAGDWVKYGSYFLPYFIVSILLCIPAVYDGIWEHRRNPLVIVLLFILFWLSIYVSANAGSNVFMYFSY